MVKKTKKKTKTSIENKILTLQKEFGEDIIVSFSCTERNEIRLELCMPKRSWNNEEVEGHDEDGPCEINPPDFNMLTSEVNYFG
tara:strand:- start:21 stop:272 length:252 start_codon:yes stop_codon:yes gene_type:complete